jgi:SanA protein
MRAFHRKPFVKVLLLSLLLALLVTLPRKFLGWHYRSDMYSIEDAPVGGTAIVFGAGLRHNGRPSAVLADRVAVASSLYRQGKVTKILMSGSIRPPGYDEPAAMRELAIDLGVPQDAILMDRGGSRTFETCRRAKDVFHLRQALLVSQEFHLPRALGICNSIGLDALGVKADLRPYRSFALRFWQMREIPATLVAIWDTVFSRSTLQTPSPETSG